MVGYTSPTSIGPSGSPHPERARRSRAGRPGAHLAPSSRASQHASGICPRRSSRISGTAGNEREGQVRRPAPLFRDDCLKGERKRTSKLSGTRRYGCPVIFGGSGCADGFPVDIPFTLQWPPIATGRISVFAESRVIRLGRAPRHMAGVRPYLSHQNLGLEPVSPATGHGPHSASGRRRSD